jgi:hypothetical protein
MNYVSFLTAHLEYLLARGADYTNGENPMNTKERIRHLAEQDGLTFEEAEDILLDAAESEGDRRRDDALESKFADNDE